MNYLISTENEKPEVIAVCRNDTQIKWNLLQYLSIKKISYITSMKDVTQMLDAKSYGRFDICNREDNNTYSIHQVRYTPGHWEERASYKIIVTTHQSHNINYPTYDVTEEKEER